MRTLMQAISISLASMLGIVSMSYAQVDPPNTFQVLSLSAIGGADFPREQGWEQKSPSKWVPKNLSGKELTYVCKSDSCEFSVFTRSFATSLRQCNRNAEVSFIQNVLVIPPGCASSSP